MLPNPTIMKTARIIAERQSQENKNERLLKLTEVLTRRFPDMQIASTFGELGMITFNAGTEDTFKSDYAFIEHSTDQEIMEKAKAIYLYKKELENESRNETRR